MDGWHERLEGLRTRYREVSPRTRLLGIALVGLAVAAGLFFATRSSFTPRVVLFSALEPQEAARIVERLRALNVPYDLAEGATTIRVPEPLVHETRLTLASEGLPRGSGVGFEIFDQARFGESDFSEQVQFRRALEGELGRTIGHLGGVRSARVHLVLPERTLFASDRREASASVALHLEPGPQLRPEQVEGVAHLVASSVPGLQPDAVTVVDGEGRSLRGRSGGEHELSSDTEALRRQIERDRERAVQALLDRTLGPGAAVVSVSADLDLSREEELSESYDPERTATRSFELTQERDVRSEAEAQGVPGAVSNLPGGAAVEQSGNDERNTRLHERRNYEVTKTVTRAVRPVGRLARLTVAVVLDGRWTEGSDEPSFERRSDEELEQVRALVADAAGLSEARGDSLTVQCVPFARREAPEFGELERTSASDLDARWEWIAAAVLGVVLLFAIFVWRRRRRRQEPEASNELVLASDHEEVDVDAYASDLSSQVNDDEELRALVLEVARRDPELTARVVRGWLLAGDEAGAERRAA